MKFAVVAAAASLLGAVWRRACLVRVCELGRKVHQRAGEPEAEDAAAADLRRPQVPGARLAELVHNLDLERDRVGGMVDKTVEALGGTVLGPLLQHLVHKRVSAAVL